MDDVNKKHVAVIGAGLAGLISALTIQKQGHQVTLIDKRHQVGGLCGTFYIGEREFVIACNDFGEGLVKMLAQLDVKLDFEYKKSSIFYRNKWFNASPDIDMVKKLKGDWKNLCRLILAILTQQLPFKKTQTIGHFVDKHTTPGAVNDLAKIISYFMGVAPNDIQTSYFTLDKTYNYGYINMACPVGGPQVMSDAIANEFTRLKGALRLNRHVTNVTPDNDKYHIEFNNGKDEIIVDAVIDTSERASNYSEGTKRGLPLSMLCLSVKKEFIYPEDTHTLSYYQENVSSWFTALDKGEKPDKFGFHVFKSDLKQQIEDEYTINAYFYLPRDINQLDEEGRSYYCDYILSCLEQMLPGIKQHIVFQELITPDDFVHYHGLSSRVMPFIHHDNKPTIKTDNDNILRAGHTIYPPGEHAGAAALSGYMAATHWLKKNNHT
ncbi:hypothetical protein tinsulaeT_10800 [Thalassotalea insulae]|uniref:Amine oxidase domain-containing protein n=1 Tax=Thalassotalea insulae TaxID=2056778 RepID=A0ABQ6GTG2_9GAMM|nr:FAD-dependent oxidoreductase [Thalassotalea insulae]GLX77740.1 hypothetical protein tinsulaeT_10800 [Thalassotalea insulae]